MPGRFCVLGGLLAMALPLTAQAQFGPFPFGGCHLPAATCGCAQPVIGCHLPPPPRWDCGCAVPLAVIPQPILQTTLRPVVENSFRAEQVTIYQPVARTQIRREAETVNVPVTVNKQVTVDEGGYQMVWIPRPVTRTVAETLVQQQVQYRDVPYQVVEQVPTLQTRLIPQQSVRYIPETRPIGLSSNWTSPIGALPLFSSLPPTAAASPTLPVEAAAEPFSRRFPEEASPSPSPAAQTGRNWVKIPQRGVEEESDVQLQSYERSGRESELPPRRLFRPAPSAATVWQAQSAFSGAATR